MSARASKKERFHKGCWFASEWIPVYCNISTIGMGYCVVSRGMMITMNDGNEEWQGGAERAREEIEVLKNERNQ